MTRLLEGKCAVVEGSGPGIGREMALALARHGDKVEVNDTRTELKGRADTERRLTNFSSYNCTATSYISTTGGLVEDAA